MSMTFPGIHLVTLLKHEFFDRYYFVSTSKYLNQIGWQSNDFLLLRTKEFHILLN